MFEVAIKCWMGVPHVPCVQRMCLIPLVIMLSPTSDVVTHHNKLQDTLTEACRRTHQNFKVDNLTHDHSHSRPADIMVPNWYFDLYRLSLTF